jgi:hypothetical protein
LISALRVARIDIERDPERHAPWEIRIRLRSGAIEPFKHLRSQVN